jgi:hypothetical protein
LTKQLERQNNRLHALMTKSEKALHRTFEAIQLLEKRAMQKRRKAKRKGK